MQGQFFMARPDSWTLSTSVYPLTKLVVTELLQIRFTLGTSTGI